MLIDLSGKGMVRADTVAGHTQGHAWAHVRHGPHVVPHWHGVEQLPVVQARALHLQQVLLGYLIIPDSMDQPVEMQINPEGMEDRGKSQVAHPFRVQSSNQGLDSGCKALTPPCAGHMGWSNLLDHALISDPGILAAPIQNHGSQAARPREHGQPLRRLV